MTQSIRHLDSLRTDQIPVLSQRDFEFAELPTFFQQVPASLKVARVGFCCLQLETSIRDNVPGSLFFLAWW